MENLEMQKKSAASASTQNFLLISEIKDDVVVTRDGGLRAVLAVSSSNFALKSQEEQNAIIARYQSFLNSLEFPIQILMQSRHLDIHGYLEKVRSRQMQQTNELLRMQTEEYVEYVNKLLEFGHIMNKTFYVIIPFSAGGPVKQGLMQKFKNLINPSAPIVASKQKFEADKQHLNDRVSRVEAELNGLNLRTMRLNTQELVELLFNSYNIDSAQKGRVELEQLKLSS